MESILQVLGEVSCSMAGGQRHFIENTENFAKLILKRKYKSYEQSLHVLDLPTVDARKTKFH